jgi:glycosyltransferase involved in cell wall biosynthesis
VLPDLNGGGAERVALTLAQDLLVQGHEVDIVLTHSGGELIPLVPTGARLFELKAKRFRHALLRLMSYFRERRPQATHALMWPVTIVTIFAHRLARNPGRLVVSEHTTLSGHYGNDKKAMSRIRRSTSLWYGAADARICVSEGAARDLVALSGLPRDKFDVIYNPVVPPAIMPVGSDTLRSLWPGGGARILSVGSFKAAKNHALLIRAFAKVAQQLAASLLILGEGQLRNDMEALVEELGVADRVNMPGFAVDPWPMYASADVFVLSSDYEGYGNVLLEAMHSGLTVVSTDCENGPREILDDGRYGRLVSVGNADALANAIIEAIADPASPDILKSRAKALSAGSLDEHLKALFGDTGAWQRSNRILTSVR